MLRDFVDLRSKIKPKYTAVVYENGGTISYRIVVGLTRLALKL